MMSWGETIGLITGMLTIAGVIVGLTRYVSQLQSQLGFQRLNAEIKESDIARANLAAANKALIEELSVVRRTGGAASAKKAEIDAELSALMTLSSSEAGSVYLPLSDHAEQVLGLVFLAIQPVTEQTMKLRKKIIPLHSLAGRCYTDGRPFIVTNARTSQDHYDKADEVSGYRTEDMLNIPLRATGKVVGVLQLLNKRGEEKFSERDLDKFQQLSAKIAAKVQEFSLLPGSMELLGVVPDTDTEFATIMFCDLTASSVLFQELNVSAAVQHINEYLEELCNVAFRYGATVDKYMGDGVLFRFNVPHPVANHPLAALRTALEMEKAFETIKKDWLTMGEVVNPLYTRVGLAYGPVQKATVGHPQYQYQTIFGRAVNSAVNLCESARRDRSVIVIDQSLYEQLSKKIRSKQIPAADLGKARHYTSSAYEVIGLAED